MQTDARSLGNSKKFAHTLLEVSPLLGHRSVFRCVFLCVGVSVCYRCLCSPMGDGNRDKSISPLNHTLSSTTWQLTTAVSNRIHEYECNSITRPLTWLAISLNLSVAYFASDYVPCFFVVSAHIAFRRLCMTVSPPRQVIETWPAVARGVFSSQCWASICLVIDIELKTVFYSCHSLKKARRVTSAARETIQEWVMLREDRGRKSRRVNFELNYKIKRGERVNTIIAIMLSSGPMDFFSVCVLQDREAWHSAPSISSNPVVSQIHLRPKYVCSKKVLILELHLCVSLTPACLAQGSRTIRPNHMT